MENKILTVVNTKCMADENAGEIDEFDTLPAKNVKNWYSFKNRIYYFPWTPTYSLP